MLAVGAGHGLHGSQEETGADASRFRQVAGLTASNDDANTRRPATAIPSRFSTQSDKRLTTDARAIPCIERS